MKVRGFNSSERVPTLTASDADQTGQEVPQEATHLLIASPSSSLGWTQQQAIGPIKKDIDLETNPTNYETPDHPQTKRQNHSKKHSILLWLNIFINILNWYAFAAFGYLTDVLSHVFLENKGYDQYESKDLDPFKHDVHNLQSITANATIIPSATQSSHTRAIQSSSNSSLIHSFAIFGISFLVRPLGGLFFGYIGDTHGRHLSLLASVWTMAIATIGLGSIPTSSHHSYRWLILARLLQGLSAGGQLMTSLVFSVESYPHSQWGLMGSIILTAANFGNFLSGASVYALRDLWMLTPLQMETWGWRIIHWIPGSLLFLCAGILQYAYHDNYDNNDENEHHDVKEKRIMNDARIREQAFDPVTIKQSSPTIEETYSTISTVVGSTTSTDDAPATIISNTHTNPIRLALAINNRRSLLAACMVPVLGSAGFWLTFVWMPVYMYTLSPHTVEHAFGINAWALFFSIIVFFPIAGHLSDVYSRRGIMTMGGVGFGVLSPYGIYIISFGIPSEAFLSQLCMGITLSLWCAPMSAWLAESFSPEKRLTSVALGYNIGVGFFSGIAPAFATFLVQRDGYMSVTYLFGFVSLIGITGLWIINPGINTQSQ